MDFSSPAPSPKRPENKEAQVTVSNLPEPSAAQPAAGAESNEKTPPHHPQEEKEETSGNSHSDSQSEDYWRRWNSTSWWHGWNWGNGHEEHVDETPTKADETPSKPATSPNPHDAPCHEATDETPREETKAEETQVTEAIVPSSPKHSTRTDTVSRSIPPPVTSHGASIRVEQVTARAKTQSMQVARNDDRNAMLALYRMSMDGAPLNREDRMARQTLENQLALPPDLYNLLVFGADDTGPSPSAVTATCALPPSQPSIHPP